MFPFSVSQATGGRVGVFVFRTKHMRPGGGDSALQPVHHLVILPVPEFELEGCDAFEISATTRASNIWSLSGSLERQVSDSSQYVNFSYYAALRGE